MIPLPVCSQDVPVEVELIIDRPLQQHFHDARGLVYGIPHTEPEVLLRYDGSKVERIGRASDQAIGLELPMNFEHSRVFLTEDNRLISTSNPSEEVAIIDLSTLKFDLYPFSTLGIHSDVNFLGIAEESDRWVSFSQTNDTVYVAEWNEDGVSRSFSLSLEVFAEGPYVGVLGDTLIIDAYPAGVFAYTWEGQRLKEFSIVDFVGGTQEGGNTDYAHISKFAKLRNGKIYATTRWYYPSLWEYNPKELRFYPAPHPFTGKDSKFVSIPLIDELGNQLYAGGDFFGPYTHRLIKADGTVLDLGKSLGKKAIPEQLFIDFRPFLTQDLSKSIWSLSSASEMLRIRIPAPRIKYFIATFGYRRPFIYSPDTFMVNTFRYGIYKVGGVGSDGEIGDEYLWYKGRQNPIREGKRIVRGPDGLIWGNDESMLFGVDPQTNEAKEVPLPGPMGEDWGLLPGKKALVALKDGRLVRINLVTGAVDSVPSPLLNASGKIVTVHTRVNGDVWLGTDRGLFFGRPRGTDFAWSRVLPNAEENFTVYDIYEEEEERWWIATNLGWINFNPVTQEIRRRYTTADGLASNEVRSTVFAKGHYWIGTRSGLSRFEPETEHFRTFSPEEGFSSRKFTPGAAYAPGINLVGVGTDNGFNYFHPEDLFDDDAPAISLSIIKYFDKKKDTIELDVGSAHLHNQISLPANHRALEIAFFIDDFSDPQQNAYAYRFQGEDTTWVDIKEQSRLFFNALPTGNQVLEIRGRTRFSAWSAPFTLKVEVAEFFYNTWWFRTLLSLLVIGTAGAWIYRLRLEKRTLTAKVEERTATIRRDKEVIEHQAESLKTLDAAKTRFFANISHELRTPLTVIRGFATEAEKRPQEQSREDLVKSMGFIKSNSDRLLLLINQLLELGKLEAGKLTPNYRRMNVRPELDLILGSFEAVAQNQNLHLRSSFSFTRLIADLDGDKFLKIIYNLLSNAIKFTPPGGQIVIEADIVQPGELQVRVVDDGIGIDEELLESIFQRFSQVDDSLRKRAEGTGIGLNFSRELAELMGGTLTVVSKKDEGSTFTLTLPLRQKGVEKSEVVSGEQTEHLLPVDHLMTSAQPTTTVPTPSDEIPLILIVEDNQDIIAYLRLCLEGNYQVFTARNGKEGVEIARKQIPDLVLSDVMMPVMDGLELCQTLKREKQTSHIPIVLLTALGSVQNRVKGLRNGADAYLSKPFSREELAAQIENLLAQRQRMRQFFSPAQIAGSERLTSEEEIDYHLVENDFLKKLYSLIEDRLDDSSLTTEELAQSVQLSQSQLWRKIKAVTGLSTNEFTSQYRLRRAAELLSAGHLSISEVAYQVGFSNPSYFTRKFGQLFGQTPSEYLNKGD